MIRKPEAAIAWWRDLMGLSEKSGGAPDRAAAATLRRCATVAEAMMERPAIDLFRRCGAGHAEDLPRVALTAAVLAHVRGDTGRGTVARLIGPDKPDEANQALMKPLRFKRLMTADSVDDQLIAFRRLVNLCDGRLPVGDLALSLLGWTEARRRRWVYDYWNAGQPEDPRASAAASPTSSFAPQEAEVQ